MATQTQTTPTKDHIQKNILLRAPRSRVWRAVADPQEFGSWFGLKIEGQVSPGSKVTGTIVPTTVDATVAKQQREYEGLQFEMTIDRVEPERLFSFRWHPYGSIAMWITPRSRRPSSPSRSRRARTVSC
jgi:uncharacterized protein YndB with AHSA1/START domain